jgi:hypothetical protein
LTARDFKGADNIYAEENKLVVGSLAARDYKGVGSQYVDEGKVIVEPPISIDRSAFNQGPNAKWDTPISDDPVVPPLIARGPHAVLDSTAHTMTIAAGFKPGQSAKGGIGYQEKVSPTLEAGGGGNNRPAVLQTSLTVGMREGKPSRGKCPLISEEKSPTLGCANDQTVFIAPSLTATNDPSRSPQASEVTQQVAAVVEASMAVRRLTPLECERLMGWPDDWTAGQADSHRYKQCGNGVVSSVAWWIARHLPVS